MEAVGTLRRRLDDARFAQSRADAAVTAAEAALRVELVVQEEDAKMRKAVDDARWHELRYGFVASSSQSTPPPPLKEPLPHRSPRASSPYRYGSPWATNAGGASHMLDRSYHSPSTPFPPYASNGSLSQANTWCSTTPGHGGDSWRDALSPWAGISASRPTSPRPTSPRSFNAPLSAVAHSLDRWGYMSPGSPARHVHLASILKSVLEAMLRQAEADMRYENAKALLPRGSSLEEIFDGLDRFHKGYVADTDLWQLTQDYGVSVPFSAIATLVNEVQLRWPRGRLGNGHPLAGVLGRLSFREAALLVLPAYSLECQAVRDADSDTEAKSQLFHIKYTEPCPRCGTRVQRNTDSAGCPNVSCTVCGTSFRCYFVTGDHYGLSISAATWSHLTRMLENGARIAEELERDRKRLSQLPGYDLATLNDVFKSISGGRVSITMSDLRLAFSEQCILIPEQELGLLWQRYAGPQGHEANFTDFSRQLRSHVPGLSTLL